MRGDLYSNKPFSKLFETVERGGEGLRPLWSGVAVPFPDEPKKGGPSLSYGTIHRIQTMKRQGFKTGFIAEKGGVSPETVRRWAKRQTDPSSPAADGDTPSS